MANIKTYIDFLDGNGFVSVANPIEWKDLEIELSFEAGTEKVSGLNYSFTSRENPVDVNVAEKINDHIAAGLTTGAGIFEGLPTQIRIECATGEFTVVDGCMNFVDVNAQFSCWNINIHLREKANIDFLNGKSQSFRFEYLYNLPVGAQGKINNSDFLDIYYVIGRYPQKGEIMLATLSLFVVLKETYEMIKRIADVLAAVLGGATGLAESTAQLIALVAYTVLLIIALINLINDLIDLIFPFVYYHRGMKALTLFQRACAFCGLNFSSSIFTGVYANYVIMPPKRNANGVNDGYKVGQVSSEYGFYEGTFYEFIQEMIKQFNGKIKIENGTLYFEVENTYLSQSNYVIPQTKNIYYGYNAGELKANYTISYQYDGADLYNLDNPTGTQFQATFEPLNIVNKQNNLLTGLEEININMTLPHVKTTQSRLEGVMQNVFNGFAGVVNAVTSFFGGSGSIAIPSIPSSINVLQLDTHYTMYHKGLIYLGNGYTDYNSNYHLGAKRLFDLFHYWNVVKPLGNNTQGNQWKKIKELQVPMCCEDYLLLKDKNYATYKNKNARLKSIKWKPYIEVAKIDFEYKEKYVNNINGKYYEAGSQIHGNL